MIQRVFRIGSRGSDLALWQARHIQELLRSHFPQDEFPIEVIRTQGDRIQDRPLYRVEDKGFFTKEIEESLKAGKCDLAIHSLKDLPTASPPELEIGAIPAREDAHDVWLSRDGGNPGTAPAGARVGTSSLRRQAQLRALRPDLTLEELRGNVPTRVRKLAEGEYDAVVLARAGLYRLGLLPSSAFEIPFAWVLPAPGQGALAVQIRADDAVARERVGALDDFRARLAVTAERALLSRLQGGCLVPVGAQAEFEISGEAPAGRLRLQGMVANLSGTILIRGTRSGAAGTIEDASALGTGLAEELLSRGAGPVLDEVREFLRRSAAPAKEEPR